MAQPPVTDEQKKKLAAVVEKITTGLVAAGKQVASGVAKSVGSVTSKPVPAASSTSSTTDFPSPDPYKIGHKLERPLGHVRLPVILTTTAWAAQDKFLALWINPLSAAWSLPRRETSTKTAAGVVRNAWRNRYRNTYYDEYTIAFTFQTGNVMPSAGTPDRVIDNPMGRSATAQEPAVPPGLIDFYQFLEMVDQPMLVGRTENRHHIYYRSRVFPAMHLEGYFVGETPISFTENAEGNANMLQWTATFQVYSSNPPINNSKQLISSWIAAARREMMSEIFSPAMLASPTNYGITSYDNNRLGNKPLPTVTSGAKGGMELTSMVNTLGKKVGLAVGSIAGVLGSAMKSAMSPEVLVDNNQGRVVPKGVSPKP
jgi:hypothetical protein